MEVICSMSEGDERDVTGSTRRQRLETVQEDGGSPHVTQLVISRPRMELTHPLSSSIPSPSSNCLFARGSACHLSQGSLASGKGPSDTQKSNSKD